MLGGAGFLPSTVVYNHIIDIYIFKYVYIYIYISICFFHHPVVQSDLFEMNCERPLSSVCPLLVGYSRLSH